jgi:hypothetical protein
LKQPPADETDSAQSTLSEQGPRRARALRRGALDRNQPQADCHASTLASAMPSDPRITQNQPTFEKSGLVAIQRCRLEH